MKKFSEFAWGKAIQLPNHSYEAAAFQQVHDKFYMVWADSDDECRMYYAIFNPATNGFEGRYRLGRMEDDVLTRSWNTPALSNYQGRLNVAWHRYGSDDIYYATLDGAWNQAIQLRDVRIGGWKSPSMAVVGNRNVVVYNGRYDNSLWCAWLENTEWRVNQKLPYEINTNTSAWIANEGLDAAYVYWQQSGEIWSARYESAKGWVGSPIKVNLNPGTFESPSAIYHKGAMFLSWTRNKMVYYSFYDGVDWVKPIKVGNIDKVESHRGTTLGEFNGQLFLGWNSNYKDFYSVFGCRKFSFVFVSDIHITENDAQDYGRGTRADNFKCNQNLVKAVNDLPKRQYNGVPVGNIDFLMAGGDLAYGEAGASTYTFMDNVLAILSGLKADTGKMPFFLCSGNHDVADSKSTNNEMRYVFEKCQLNGAYPYSFDVQGIHFVALRFDDYATQPNKNDSGRPWLSLDFLESDLKDLPADTPLILMHHYGYDNYSRDWLKDENKDRYFKILTGRKVVAILSGHSHVPGLWDTPAGTSTNFVGGCSDVYNGANDVSRIWLFQLEGNELIVRHLGWGWQDGSLHDVIIDYRNQNGQPKRISTSFHQTSFA